MSDELILTQIDGGVLTVTLNEPKRRNPLGHQVRLALVAALSEAEKNPEVLAVVLTGAGGNFSTGGDIKDQGVRSLGESRERFAVVKDLIGRMTRYPKPLIAAVEGWAVGAGWSLALACDTIIAAEGAQFVAPFRKIGLIPDFGMLATLPARIGTGRARKFWQTAEPLAAKDAFQIGAIDYLADDGQALEFAQKMATEAASHAPMPRAFTNDFLARSVDEAVEYERQLQPLLLKSTDAAEGRKAFYEKRAPEFKGE